MKITDLKWTRYVPETTIVPGALYLKNEKGQDWYQYVSSIKKEGTYIQYDENGQVYMVNTDPTKFFPEECYFRSVKKIPDDFSNRTYIFNGEDFEKIEWMEDRIFENKKQGLFQRAAILLSTYAALGEEGKVEMMKQYIIDLRGWSKGETQPELPQTA
ncbi:hypothetical protein Ro1_00224 [Raoultella phage Ro1]|uniref:Tail fiber assembly protein n=1 Tax=Raoultella phage Ro1 TaxID=2053702 RepID=A0A2H4YGY4_9CAUD|nr:tail fiber assembly protein [Raoultella phage Ro1]AUE23429.1 hypothetical protein Ro1_00224 [Raoultella phage Ro1]